MKSCGTGAEVARLDKKLITLESSVDSIHKEMLNKKNIKKEFDESMWKFLELEELSDKEKIPINKLKNDRFIKEDE